MMNHSHIQLFFGFDDSNVCKVRLLLGIISNQVGIKRREKQSTVSV